MIKFFPLLAAGLFVGCASAAIDTDTITLTMREVVTYEEPEEEEPALLQLESPKPSRKSIMQLEATHFELDSDRLTPQGEDSLEQVADLLHLYPNSPVVLVGHTCSLGREAHNQDLSLRRARAVRRLLRQQHAITNPIKIVGKGSSQPAESNEIAAGREANRRVEVFVLKK